LTALLAIAEREIGPDRIPTVNARELHKFLEVGKDFSTWIKDRIDQYGFFLDLDFVICSPVSGSSGRGGRNRKDYHLSLDTAKQLSMVERTEKGRQARLYFLECEKRAKSLPIAAPVAPSQEPNPVAKISVDICLFQAYASTFKIADSSKIALLRQIGERHGADTSILPAYAVDEPRSSHTGSSFRTAALTVLLANSGARMKAHEFNEWLERAGFLQKNERKTNQARYADRGGVKPFWTIIGAGLEFGKNMTDPSCPRETQPHWYADTFNALLERVREVYRQQRELFA
jgi:phage anti-repressor protein